MNVLAVSALALAVAVLGLWMWRRSDDTLAARVWQNPVRGSRRPRLRFEPGRVDGLPEPARRYFRLQPFGGFPSEFREFGACTLPARVEGGYFIGTEDNFPFYRARIEDVTFLVDDRACADA